MKEILKLNLSQNSLIKINACRIYLHVFHLSDMTKPDDKQSRTEYITGKKLLQPNQVTCDPINPTHHPEDRNFEKNFD